MILFEIPMIVPILIILIIICGATFLLENLAYILFFIAQLAMLIMGIVTFKKTIGVIKKTKRYYMLITSLLFFLFCVSGLYLYYEFFCMSETYIETVYAGFGYLKAQQYCVRIYALLICLATGVAYMIMMSIALKADNFKSLFISILCILLITLPMYWVYRDCNQQYYAKNAIGFSEQAELQQDIVVIWKSINNSENRFPYFEANSSDLPIICPINAGSSVYLTGNESTINGDTYLEIYLEDRTVIGYIPASSIQ